MSTTKKYLISKIVAMGTLLLTLACSSQVIASDSKRFNRFIIMPNQGSPLSCYDSFNSASCTQQHLCTTSSSTQGELDVRATLLLGSIRGEGYSKKEIEKSFLAACQVGDDVEIDFLLKRVRENTPEWQEFVYTMIKTSLMEAIYTYPSHLKNLLIIARNLTTQCSNRDIFVSLIKEIFDNEEFLPILNPYTATFYHENGVFGDSIDKLKLILFAAEEVEMRQPGFIAALFADERSSGFLLLEWNAMCRNARFTKFILRFVARYDSAANKGILSGILTTTTLRESLLPSLVETCGFDIFPFLMRLSNNYINYQGTSLLESIAPLLSRKDLTNLAILARNMDVPKCPDEKRTPLPFAAMFSALLPYGCVFAIWSLYLPSLRPTGAEILAILDAHPAPQGTLTY